MPLESSDPYRQVIDQVKWSRNNGYGVFQISEDDIALARLFAYAFRTQTVGPFRSTRQWLERHPTQSAARLRAVEALRGLEELSLVSVPRDMRALVGTMSAYDRGLRSVLRALADAVDDEADAKQRETLAALRDAFLSSMNRVTTGNGIWTATDDVWPQQMTFKVPGITVVVVPLVYGDHHGWNNALVVAGSIGRTTHRHRQGVEIHLGFGELYGRTLLGDHAATVREGYAMPIPVGVDHGFDNLGEDDHLVPFIFGSRRLGGWGIFADVEPRQRPVASFREAAIDSTAMNGTILIDRAIAAAREWPEGRRETLIGAERTVADLTGGLALRLSRLPTAGLDVSGDDYQILSVREGRCWLRLGPVERELAPHDHVGIPAGMDAWLEPAGTEPCLVLDATLTGGSAGA